ncbi:hypothetical protein FQA47_015153 [Oryzias melastigma]|uniref:Uncharacterized protein n=1 Tax=Oryzias melastigma TaxID=30732 RepID=A0A834CKQ4_ORYME|nr:hypothetical protein FQA47_015153 [Oryzias melastigma]
MSKHRQKSSEKSPAPAPEDAPKKPQKSSNATTNGGPGGPQGPRASSGCLGLFASTLFYVALIGAAGFAAFHLQQVVEEFRHANAKHEESARHNAEMSGKMESVVQQVDSLRKRRGRAGVFSGNHPARAGSRCHPDEEGGSGDQEGGGGPPESPERSPQRSLRLASRR